MARRLCASTATFLPPPVGPWWPLPPVAAVAAASGCTGNGGNGGIGNAGATTGAAANSEPNASAPGGAANGQGFGGGGGGSDSDKQAAGGGGGGGVGAVRRNRRGHGDHRRRRRRQQHRWSRWREDGEWQRSGGRGGLWPQRLGQRRRRPARRPVGRNRQGGGGGGAGYYGGGSGAVQRLHRCSRRWALVAAVPVPPGWPPRQLTSFTNGSNPAFVAGSGTSNACGAVRTTQGSSWCDHRCRRGAARSASGIANGWAGCPGNVSLTWSALPGAPTGVTATGASGQITASWTAPADPGTSSITGYQVTATPVGGGSPVSQTFNSTATTETLTGLTNGDAVQRDGGGDLHAWGPGPRPVRRTTRSLSARRRASPRPTSTTFTVGSAGSFTVTTSGSSEPLRSPRVGALPSGRRPSPTTVTARPRWPARRPPVPEAPTRSASTRPTASVPNASQTFTLTVDEAPSITSGDSATFDEGNAGSSTMTTTGYPTASLSESGALPSGVTFTRQR